MDTITKLVVVCENPGYTLTDQNGDYLADAGTLEGLIEVAKKYAADYDLDEMTISLS